MTNNVVWAYGFVPLWRLEVYFDDIVLSWERILTCAVVNMCMNTKSNMHELAHGRRSLHAGQTCFPNSLAPSSSQKTSLTQSRQKKVLRISKVSYTYIYIKIGGKDTWARGDPGNCSQPLSALLVVAYQVVLHDVQHSSSSRPWASCTDAAR